MGDNEEVLKPRMSGDFLLVVEVAQTFSRLGVARAAMNPKRMVLLLESASLLLTGYYPKKGISQADTKKRLRTIMPEIDKLTEQFLTNDSKRASPKIWTELYDIEEDLREVWHLSGLQIGKSEDQSNGAEFN
jgi:hypothetical protein